MSPDPLPACVRRGSILLAGLALLGCPPPPSSTTEEGATAAETAKLPGLAGGSGPLEGGPIETIRRPEPGLRIDWPEGWRVLERGSFTSGEDDVVWMRVESPDPDPAASSNRALDAVESLIADVRFRHVAASESNASRAVGQLRSDSLFAVVDARGGGSSTTVLVSLAMKRAS